MAVAIEAMGLSLPYSSSIPAEDPGKADECRRAGAAIRTLLERDLKPRDIVTRESLENALTMVMALEFYQCGAAPDRDCPRSTCAAGAGGLQRVGDRVPLLADLKPSGRYVQEDLHKVGGTPAVMKYLLERGFLHGDCMTVTGDARRNLADAAPLAPGQRVIHSIEQPVFRAVICGSFAETSHRMARSPRSPEKKGAIRRPRASL